MSLIHQQEQEQEWLAHLGEEEAEAGTETIWLSWQPDGTVPMATFWDAVQIACR